MDQILNGYKVENDEEIFLKMEVYDDKICTITPKNLIKGCDKKFLFAI